MAGDVKPWFIYMVMCADNTLYTGISNNVDKRIKVHNTGRGAKYTKTRRPVTLVYSQEIGSRSDAAKREYAIKQLSRAEKESVIGSMKDNTMDKRLQKVLAEAQPIKDEQAKKFKAAAVAKQKAAEEEKSLQWKRAQEWVDESLFLLIKEAEVKDCKTITIRNYVNGAPGNFIAELVNKIEGLKVTPQYVEPFRWDDCSAMDGGYYEYIVSWK